MWQPRGQRNQSFRTNMKSKQLAVFPVLAAMGLNKGHMPHQTHQVLWNTVQEACASTMLLLKNKQSSSSSRRRRRPRGSSTALSDRVATRKATKKAWSHPAAPPTANLYNLEKKRKVSWESHLRRDRSTCKQTKSPERKFQRHCCRTQWRKKKQQKGQWWQLEKVSKAQGHPVRQRTRVTVWETETKYECTVHYGYAIPSHKYQCFQTMQEPISKNYTKS